MATAPTPPLPIAVLASGRGSNLQALLTARESGTLPIDVVLVASDKAEAPALRIAEAAGIATLALDPRGFAERAAYDRELFARLAAAGPELVVLAGFMRILDAAAIAPWIGRMINVHPSLLPKYRGLHTHRRALRAGDAEHGASVHFVTGELDGGPLIAQARLAVLPDDDEAALSARLLPLEHRLLAAVVAGIAAGSLSLEGEQVRWKGGVLECPLALGAGGTLVASAPASA
ncbi:MAG TPA: phosphoribosylglycinamide formyltransferase [Rhodanobacteraceae bacterium]|nr:phosphoribosylglycinamide formyltransferase [Rhodanobacteraceae bacterium]